MKSASNTEEDETFTFKVNRRQLRVIRTALDNYARMGMGQLEVSVEEFLRMHFYDLYYEKNPGVGDPHHETVGEMVKSHLDFIKYAVFGHSPHGSWGIYNEKVPADCREAYDIRQVVGKADVEASRREGVDRSWDVDNRSYLPTNPEEPPIEIKSNGLDLSTYDDRLRDQFTEFARRPLNLNEYWSAPSGEGPLAAEWNDKPHRLLYDLIGEVVRIQEMLTDEERGDANA